MPIKIIVFVKNKLISLDTVLPILLEMKVKHNVRSEIIVSDKLANDAIQKNIVLKDVINYVGCMRFITKGSKVRVFRYINALVPLVNITIGILKGDKIIHFGHLDAWPLKIFSLLFGKNIYRMQGTAFNFNYPKIVQKRRNSPYPILYGQNVIICSENIENTRFKYADEKKIYKIGETRTRESWVEYIDSKSDYYFNKYHGNIDISNGFIVFILGGIDRDFTYNLFLSTIKVLNLANKSIPVLIKPHAYTNINNLKKAIVSLDLFHITYLHPSLLASKARVFIANGFSNTLADAHAYGVKTIQFSNFTPDPIEYAGYSPEELKIRSKVSIEPKYVDYFINNDSDKLLKIMREVLDQKYIKSNFKGNINSDEELFISLLK